MVDELPTCGRDHSIGIREQNLPEEEVVFDEESRYNYKYVVGVIDVHVKDLIDTRGSVFAGPGERK